MRFASPAAVGWSSSAWTALAIVGSIALFLAWRVLTMGLADSWVDAAPQTALFWRPMHPEALVDAADDALAHRRFSEAKALALNALRADPLDGRAYRDLATFANFFGDKVKASRLLRIAIRRAPRDLPTRSKLLEYALTGGNLPEALHQVDMELRIRPEMATDLMPGLVLLSQYPGVLGPLSHLLESRPPWRLRFLTVLAASGSDPRLVDRIFAQRGGDDPLLVPRHGTEADLLMQRQIKDARWDSAYFTWVTTLSKAERTLLGNVYDGGFVFPPSGRGFAWQLPVEGMGFDVLIAPRMASTTDNVLQIRFDGLPVEYQPIKQRLILGPGHYRLTGMAQSNGITSDDGLHWTLWCAEGMQRPLASSQPFTGDIAWGRFQVDFDVPDADCASQWLRLDLGLGIFKGQPLEGSAIFDDLTITRL